MKTKMNILNNNGKYHFFNALKIEEELENKNYLFNFDELGNCWLEDVESFKFPSKIYDVDSNLRKYIAKSYSANNKNLGVLLTGNKGQGKSHCAKLICSELKQPTIIINKQIPADINFVKFLSEIKQDHTLFVDEFEKLFDTKKESNETNGYHTQETFLSFMDGVITNEHKVLFLLTTNDGVNEFFINRPSRIKFLQEYNELPEELFNLITDDKLNNPEYKQDLEDNISLVNLNIDLLISIIDDINLFDEPFSTFMSMYNYKFEQYKYEVFHIENGVDVFKSFHTTSKKIKYTDYDIAGERVLDMLVFKADEIVFKAKDWQEDKKGKDIEVDIVVKLVPATRMSINKLVF
jgi:hypothetical protein